MRVHCRKRNGEAKGNKLWRIAHGNEEPHVIRRGTNPPATRGPEMSNCQRYKNAMREPHLSGTFRRGRRRTRPCTRMLQHPTRTSRRNKDARGEVSVQRLRPGGIDRLKKDGARDEGPVPNIFSVLRAHAWAKVHFSDSGILTVIRALAPPIGFGGRLFVVLRGLFGGHRAFGNEMAQRSQRRGTADNLNLRCEDAQ